MVPAGKPRLTTHFKRLNSIHAFLIRSVIVGIFISPGSLLSQPAEGAGKFLGNITTYGRVRSDFGEYWNQITGENESKWEFVEGTRDRMRWDGTDRIAEYAREAGISWKFHCLIWGSQYPRWMDGLSQSEQLEEITEWMDEAAERYPDVQMIDVINEAYPTHKPPPFKNALGGDGATGFDWMIKAFEMARERWPDAVLIYNDFNTIEYGNEVNWQVKMANAMKEADAPMDAIGVQAHAAAGLSTSSVKSNIDRLAETGYPIIVSEYDIAQSDDTRQKSIMEDQFTMFWNHPKVAGITYWGYIVGMTWRNGTGLLHDGGDERPALTWLVNFVEENPDPPNDFPDLIPAEVGTIAPNDEFFIARSDTSTRVENRRIEVFDLHGRMLFSGDRAVPFASNMPPQGTCVVRMNGQCTGSFSTIR